MKQSEKWHISFNAPVTLSFALICVAVHLLSIITGGASGRLLFSVYRSSFADPLAYLRCFLHVFGHFDWDHLLSNIMYLLILGPMLEEKHGPLPMVIVMVTAAFCTGIMNLIFFPDVRLMGASGIVFALILLSSFTAAEEHTIPASFIAVAILYLGQQIYQGLFTPDHISQMAHIVGGIVGSVLGFILNRSKIHRKEGY